MKLLVAALAFLLAACSSTPTRALSSAERPGPQCDEQAADSARRLAGLRKVFETYRELPYELALKFVPVLKAEARDLESRIDLQRRLCWASERRALDTEIAQLRSDIDRLYLDRAFQELRRTDTEPAAQK